MRAAIFSYPADSEKSGSAYRAVSATVRAAFR
jgi:hypothetical protein